MTLALARHELLLLLGELARVFFVFVYGASIGSLTNVLVYRLPRGIGVVTPSSRCPRCGHALRWKDNLPVVGWLLLRGRCRYCGRAISPEYPIVEATIGGVFVVFYMFWYGFANWPAILGVRPHLLGIDLASAQPEWAMAGLVSTWPYFVMLLILIGSLAAMTIVDAKTFMIPLVLAWTPAVVGIVGHPLQAWMVMAGDEARWRWAEGWSYAIPSPGSTGWGWIGAALGGMVGLGLSLALLRLGLLKRSFADFDEWEKRELTKRGITPAEHGPAVAVDVPLAGGPPDADGAEQQTPSEANAPAEGEESVAWGAGARRAWIAFLATLFTAGVGALIGIGVGVGAALGVAVGTLIGPILGGALARLLIRTEEAPEGPTLSSDSSAFSGEPGSGGGSEPRNAREGEAGEPGEPGDGGRAGAQSAADLWLEYPHARREMVREILFLGPLVACGLLGAVLARRLAGPWSIDHVAGGLTPSVEAPPWVDALAGALLGYLIGGGVVWLVRILGSLLFRKEAMGLGDVHLMAGVGACLGWIDPVVAFFVAAPVGLYVELVRRIAGVGGARRAMPFGPSLAAATLLVLLAKPWVEEGLTAWLSRPVDLP